MGCGDINDEGTCLVSSQTCAWCSASGGCCIDGAGVSTGDSCTCSGALNTIAIVSIVLGVIFWIAVCYGIYRCCQRRRVVTQQTIVVAGPGAGGSQVPYQQVPQGQPMYGQQPVQGQPMMYGQQPTNDMNGNMSPQNGQQPGPYGQMPPQQKVGGATF